MEWITHQLQGISNAHFSFPFLFLFFFLKNIIMLQKLLRGKCLRNILGSCTERRMRRRMRIRKTRQAYGKNEDNEDWISEFISFSIFFFEE